MGRAADLATVVALNVSLKVDKGESFTAYDVTKELRQYNPGEDIQHMEVRMAVHAAMLQYLNSAEYDWRVKVFPSGEAREYFPKCPKASQVKMHEVDSSAISAIGYEPGPQKLLVEFHGGRTYSYLDVPADVFARFMAADSHGQFFNLHIRDKY